MVAVVNVGEIKDKRGVYEYEVRINTTVLTRFEHTRKDGLAVCLRLASEAVVRMIKEKEECYWADQIRILHADMEGVIRWP